MGGCNPAASRRASLWADVPDVPSAPWEDPGSSCWRESLGRFHMHIISLRREDRRVTTEGRDSHGLLLVALLTSSIMSRLDHEG